MRAQAPHPPFVDACGSAAGPADRQIEFALMQLSVGRPVVLMDDSTPDREGDLVFAAEKATPELMAFVVRHTSGFVCVALPEEQADRLGMPRMWHGRPRVGAPAYAVTVDSAEHVSTGISAADRARTIQIVADPTTRPEDFHRPGHVVPLRARGAGLHDAVGRAEVACDLSRLAGLRPASALARIVSVTDPTRMAAGEDELREFSSQHGLALVSVCALAAHRLAMGWLGVRGQAQGLP
jgi:3,4-dihydroxy 2-butanone 4-phosphate synthase/GTP cyclohydrolase II